VKYDAHVKNATCHPDRPLVAKGLCRMCYVRQWRAAHPEYKQPRSKPLPRERARVNERAYRERDPERYKALKRAQRERDPEKNRATARAWYAANRDRALAANRTYRLRSLYGLTTAQWDAMLAAQGGACAICREPFGDKRAAVDHDHDCCPDRASSCGRCVRGLLCNRCNRNLGWVERRLEGLLAYLGREPQAL
jgi:hypothetical protein